MKKVVEVYNFPRMSVVDLAYKAGIIYREMSKNAEVFPLPMPSLQLLLIAITTFKNSIAASATGDRMMLITCRAEKQNLAAILQQLGGYVNVVANSGKLVGAQSGFDLVREKTSSPKVDFVASPALSGITSGRLTSVTSVVKGAIVYRHCITTDPMLPISEWKAVEVKRVRYEFMNLKPGLQYFVRTAACDKDGKWVYSCQSSRYSL